MPDAFLKRTASAIANAAALPGATLLGGWAGSRLDQWLGCSPLGAISLGALGFAAAVYQLLRPPPPDSHDPASHPPP